MYAAIISNENDIIDRLKKNKDKNEIAKKRN
jgi:hypothetical protein